jgi:chromosomal replication initiator protein
MKFALESCERMSIFSPSVMDDRSDSRSRTGPPGTAPAIRDCVEANGKAALVSRRASIATRDAGLLAILLSHRGLPVLTGVSEAVAVDLELVRQKLVARLGLAKFNLWFQSTQLALEDGALCVSMPNRFAADWIEHHFHDDLLAIARELAGEGTAVRVVVDRTAAPSTEGVRRHTAARRPSAAGVAPRAGSAPGERRNGVLRHSLDAFIVGPSNELAYTAARRLAEGAEHTPHVLFIHGGCGLGKTHLLQGLCRCMQERQPTARISYTTAEDFTNQYVQAVRFNKLSELRRRLRRVETLVVDDVHFLSSKPATQAEFLHTFDAIGQSGAKVVLASDAHPKQIQSMRDALVSRFMSGMVVRVDPPDFATRLRLVAALAQRRGLRIVESAIHAIARQVAGSVRELEGALTKLAAIHALGSGASAEEGAVGHAAVDRLLNAPVPGSPCRPVRVDEILQTVCRELGVPSEQLLGRSRHRRIVLARAAVIHLARRLTALSYPELARAMGRPNHSTIITAAQRIDRQVRSKAPLERADTELAESYDQLVEHLHRAVLHGVRPAGV